MKQYFKIALFLLCLGTSFSAFAQSEAEIQKVYTRYLENRDIENWIDNDGDVQFKYEGKTYFLEVNESDTEFFRLVLPNIWPIESEEERQQVLRAIDIANNKVKVAKMYTVNDNIWIGVEMFQADVDDFKAYFDRSIKVIETCIDYFVEEME